MPERVTIGEIGEGHVSDALGSGATELIFHVISAASPSETQELRVSAGKVKVGRNGVTIIDETTIKYEQILSVGYEDDSDESL